MRSDRMLFLHLLARAVEKYEWRVHAYCLMVTHYHLFLTTPRRRPRRDTLPRTRTASPA
jgi:REP element-mobilizing transposase RayT